MESVIPDWVAALTPGGLLLIIMLLVAKGKLIPESIHDRILSPEREARRLAEERAKAAESREDKLVGTLRTHAHLLETIRSLVGGDDDDAYRIE